jgi:hypothetical protein
MNFTVCAHSSMVERPAFNRQAPGSSPGGHTKWFLSSAGQSAVLRKRRPKVRILQEPPKCVRRSMDDYPSSKRADAGSNPAGRTKYICRVREIGTPICLRSRMLSVRVRHPVPSFLCRRLLTGIGNHTFNVDNASSTLVGGTSFASVVQWTRTLDSDSRSRQFESGRKPHACVAQWSERDAHNV